MLSDVRARLLVLVGLAVLGVALAGMGTVLGVTGFATDADATARFVVSEDNVTVSDGGEEVTVVENMSDVGAIRIAETDSRHFEVSTETDSPLTDAERERAREIARANDTVARYLADAEGYELAVDPVRKLDLGSVNRTDASLSEADGTNASYTIETVTSDGEGGTLVVQRNSSYAADRAVVRVYRPSDDSRDEQKYSIDVDLANGTVTDITDWDALRREASANGDASAGESVDIGGE